jgi:dipeptide transport system substrate-binding protein
MMRPSIVFFFARSAVVTLVTAGGLGAAHAKTLVYCLEASPTTLSPALATSMTDDVASTNQMFNRLIDIAPGTTTVVPSLAESWDISEDGLTYTFRLREGVPFHTTESFTPTRDMNAEDVVFSFERQLESNHPYHEVSGGRYVGFDWVDLGGTLREVEKVDERTVRFHLRQPDAVFLANAGGPWFSIYSAEYAEELLAAGTPEKLDEEPVGTGPFQFVEYRMDALIRYGAHPEYWDGEAKIDHLVFAITPDAAVRYQKLGAGECHVIPYPNPADIEAMRDDPALQLHETLVLDFGYLALNTEKPPLDDRRVRQAISLAIDQETLIEAVYLGLTGRPATTPVPPIIAGHNEAIAGYGYDPRAARELLAEAGHPEGFTATLWAMPIQRPYNPNPRRMAELMQADLAEVGIRVEIVSYEWGEYINRARDGAHDMMMFGWIATNADPDEFLRSSWTCPQVGSGYNFSRWCNPRFDELLELGKTTMDAEQRAAYYREAQAIWHEEAAGVAIAHSVQFTPVREEVIGYVADPLDRRLFHGVDLAE